MFLHLSTVHGYAIAQNVLAFVHRSWLCSVSDSSRCSCICPVFMTIHCSSYMNMPLECSLLHVSATYTITQDVFYDCPLLMAMPCIRYLNMPLQMSTVYDCSLYTIAQHALTVHAQDTLTTVHCLWLYPVYDSSRHPYNSPLFKTMPCIRYLKIR